MSNINKLILVTGATGYIASRLIPQLLDRGYKVRAMARNPQSLFSRNWHGKVEIKRGDVMDTASLAAALKGVHTAYYLIHSMSSGVGYTRLETQAARSFSLAAEAAGVQHIIYLGGLVDDENGNISPHLLSRIKTGETLMQGKVPVTEFRASVIAGSGSTSFEMIRFMTELFPVVPSHIWLKNKSQPIAIQNVIDYLLFALEKWEKTGSVVEIGGPDIMTYQELMQCYARARGHRRKFLFLPYIPVRLMAFGVGLVTPVPRRIARALVRGMSDDSIVTHPNAHEVYPEIHPIDFDTATKLALENLHPLKIDRAWEVDIENSDASRSGTAINKHEGFFIKYQQVMVHNQPMPVFKVLSKIAEGLGKRHFVIDTIEPNKLLLLRVQKNIPGDGWLEWHVKRCGEMTSLTQTIFFAPRGLAGFVYWYFLYPIHMLTFHYFLQKIRRECKP